MPNNNGWCDDISSLDSNNDHNEEEVKELNIFSSIL